MITIPTVFILGAGSNISYGFPTGFKLLNEINESLNNPNHKWWDIIRNLNIPEVDVISFKDELILSGQPSIDSFLEHRSEYLSIGKIIIALAIASHENQQRLTDLSVRESGFYHYLFNKLNTSKTEFPDNTLSIITFNYDRSFEQFLYLSLKHSWNISDDESRSIIDTIPIVHVHGSLGLLPWQGKPFREYSRTYSADDIQYSSEQIKIISEGIYTSLEFKHAHELLLNAKKIHFLGFGYNSTNISRLNVESSSQEKQLINMYSMKYYRMTGTSMGLGLSEREDVQSKWGIKLDDMGLNCLDYLKTYGNLK